MVVPGRIMFTALLTVLVGVGLGSAPGATNEAAAAPEAAAASKAVAAHDIAKVRSVPSDRGAGTQAAHRVQVQNVDGHWEEFGRSSRVGGSGCDLWHRWQGPAGDWSGWASLGGCLIDWGIDVGYNADGRLEVFAIGTDYAMWHMWQTVPSSGPWTGWYTMGGTTRSGPTIVGGDFDRLDVYAVGVDGRWWRNWQTQQNCCWSGWHLA